MTVWCPSSHPSVSISQACFTTLVFILNRHLKTSYVGGKYVGTLENVNHMDLVGWVNAARFAWADLVRLVYLPFPVLPSPCILSSSSSFLLTSQIHVADIDH